MSEGRGCSHGGEGGTGAAGLPRGKLVLGAIGFLGLTVGAFWWQFARLPMDAGIPTLGSPRWEYLLLLLLLLPVETVTSAARLWLLCRTLHPGVRFWTCVQAELANVAVAILTPSQSGGGPGQIYMLSRAAGVGVGTGLSLSLLSFMGTMVGLLAIGLYALLLSGMGASGLLFASAVWMLTAIAGTMLLGAAWPDAVRSGLATLSRTACRALRRPQAVVDWRPSQAAATAPAVDRMDPLTARLVDMLHAYSQDIRRFLRTGKACFAAVCLLSLVFLLARALMPYLCARFLGVEGGTFRQILDAQIALIFLVFFAPTPGGAGITEGASLSIMGDIVPGKLAPYYNLLWRLSTTYLTALAGFLCLGRALARDAKSLARRWPESR